METIKSLFGLSNICDEKGCDSQRLNKDHELCLDHFRLQKKPCCWKHTCVLCKKFSHRNPQHLLYEERVVYRASADICEYKGKDMFEICGDCKRHFRCRDQSGPGCNYLVTDDLCVKIYIVRYVFGKDSVRMIITSKDGLIKSFYCHAHKCYQEDCHKQRNCPFHSCGVEECSERPNKTGYCTKHSDK